MLPIIIKEGIVILMAGAMLVAGSVNIYKSPEHGKKVVRLDSGFSSIFKNFEIYKEKYKDHYNYEIIIKEDNRTYKHTLYENIDGELKWFDWDVEIKYNNGNKKEFITETGFGSNISWDEFEEKLTPIEKRSVDKFWEFESKDYQEVKKELDKLAKNK